MGMRQGHYTWGDMGGRGRLHSSVVRRPKFRVILTGLGRHTRWVEARASHVGERGEGGQKEEDFIAWSRGTPSSG